MQESEVIASSRVDYGTYRSVRLRSIDLASQLQTEDFIPQPVEFASPPKWHLAHTTWFFEEFILKGYQKDYVLFDQSFSFLFNSYYNTIGERTQRVDRGSITRPTVNEVMEYRSYVDVAMKALFNSELIHDPQLQQLILVGLNHEQQHQELFITDLKYAFGLNPTHPVYRSDLAFMDTKNDETGWIDLQSGIYEIGYAGDGFCFDNELGRHKVYVQDFAINKGLVTNAEYMEFITSGGYEDFRHWLDEGWTWVQENNVNSPLYWKKNKGLWHYYTLEGLKEVEPDAILTHISYYEADAFARWKGLRLPTEFEWEIACPKMNWGERWEWTQSAYLPYPGFKIAKGALGEYNGKFMVNQMVLRGASVATVPDHSRPSYRNFFHPHHQWQFSGIRLAR